MVFVVVVGATADPEETDDCSEGLDLVEQRLHALSEVLNECNGQRCGRRFELAAHCALAIEDLRQQGGAQDG